MIFWSRTSLKTFYRYLEFHASNELIIFFYSSVLLTEREGRTGNIGPWSSQSKTSEGQYFPVRLKEAMLVSNSWRALARQLPILYNSEK